MNSDGYLSVYVGLRSAMRLWVQYLFCVYAIDKVNQTSKRKAQFSASVGASSAVLSRSSEEAGEGRRIQTTQLWDRASHYAIRTVRIETQTIRWTLRVKI